MFEELTPEQVIEVRRAYDDTERYRAAVNSQTYEEYLEREQSRLAHLGKILRIGELRDQAEFVDSLSPAEREARVKQNLAAYESEQRLLDAPDSQDEERKMQQDYAVYGDDRQGSVEVLARVWHNINLGRTAEYSRPVAIVGDQLIVEVDRGKSFSARDMARALDALGREDVDRIGLRVAEPRQQAQSRGMGR